MSNNIYDILNKINKLEGRVQTLKESKSMDKKKEDKKDESMKKDKVKEGEIAEAVARVEKQLSEKYHGFKKMQEHDKMDEGDYNEDMLSPKQKKFAALAEPKDKITF